MIGGYRAGIIGCVLLALTGCTQAQWTDHRGESLSAADLDGRWLVVNYWAEWCAPCRKELPELNALDQVSDQLRVLGIHFDGYQGEQLRTMSDEMGIAFSVVGYDFAEAYGLALPQVLPTTYIIDPEGRVLHTLQGPQTEQQLLALLPLEDRTK